MLKFNFTDIKEDDVIESARLVLYCRAVPEFSGRKRILVTKNTSLWNEAEVTWKDILWNIGSYNGLPGKNDWKLMPYGDRNLFLEEVRFRSLPSVAIEYIITEDETYAYGAIRIMEDFITDTGGWYPPGAPEGRGGYTRSLDTARRAQSWMAVYRAFVQSENMNPENNTAILKNINDMGKSLYYVHADKGNWKSTEMWVLTELATMFPEFTNSGKWFELGRLEREQVVFDSYFSDGSYVEATGGYNKSSINAAIAYKKMVMNQGLAVSPEFDELLEKAAYYNLLLRAPDGTSIQFGDEAGGEKGKKTGSWFQDIVNWYDNREIEYIDTFGKRGIMPEWTSMHWPDSRITAMRSSWRPDALYMFTNVRGKGQHGHADDNHVTVYAFDKILLTDAGKYTYEWDSPTKIWINSTRAHNTVEINNKSQEQTPTTSYTIHTVEGRGDIHDWLTNNSFDFLSQSTKNTRGFDHRRTITFVKPYLWIVSDLITPNDLSSINSYKQLWHMVPSANLSIDDENKIIRSNFDQGANIIVASADGDNITTKVEMGLYDLSENQIQDTPYGYFSLEGVQGKATFDTVLVPTRNDVNAEVTAERLDTGVATNIATALKFTARSKGDANTGYYYLSYEDNPQSERNFGKYTTDGQLAFVFEGNKEDIRNIIIKNASLLKNNTDGSILLSYPGKISDMSLEWKGNRLIIRTADKDINYSNLMIATSDIVKSLLINGQETEFSIENGYIVTDGKKKTDADSKSGGAGGTIIVEGKGNFSFRR